MLFLLIPIAWLGLIAFVVVLCQMAARSDALLASAPVEPRDRGRGLTSRRHFRRTGASVSPARRRFARI